jgi:hypothetical protein
MRHLFARFLPAVVALSGSLGACVTTGQSNQDSQDTQELLTQNRLDKERSDAEDLRWTQYCNRVFAGLHIGTSELKFFSQNKFQRDPPAGYGVCAKLNSTRTAYGTHDQWVWGDGSSRYVYFENGVLTAIQE